MPLIDRIPMPGSPGESFNSGLKTGNSILDSIINRKQNQEKLQQQALVNQQLNEHRINSLEQQKLANEMMNKYRMGTLGVQQQGLGMRQQLQPMQLELLREKIEDLKRGGKGGGVGEKEQSNFLNLIAKDNPGLPQDKMHEASKVLMKGGDTLSDGTKLNEMSPLTKIAFGRLTKGSTYSGAVVPILKANQAEAELSTIMNMANKDFEPYATTYAGYSPEQIIDSFKTDDASQKRLGNFIASQAAQYESAQIRNRIAGGEPGISATQELMGKSGQIIKTMFPRLSSTARIQATKRLDEYLKEGLNSRKSVGVEAYNATNMGKPKIPYGYTPENDIGSVNPNINSSNEGNKVKKWKVVDGQLVEEK